MIIVEADGTSVERWSDPLIVVHLEQFREVAGELERLCSGARPGDLAKVRDLSARLCEGSRQIVYRMHRVTREQVSQAVELFESAYQAIAELTASIPNCDSVISAYGKHIESRARILRQY